MRVTWRWDAEAGTSYPHEYGMDCDSPDEVEGEWMCPECGATFRSGHESYQSWTERSK
jgi:hypothetical protein